MKMFRRMLVILVAFFMAVGVTVSTFTNFMVEVAKEKNITLAFMEEETEETTPMTSENQSQRTFAQTFKIRHIDDENTEHVRTIPRGFKIPDDVTDCEVEETASTEEAELATEAVGTEDATLATESANEEESSEMQTVEPLKEGTIIDPSWDVNDLVLEDYVWEGNVINAYNGTVQGPNGKETYYNLPMPGVVKIMENLGYNYEYWVRDDGMKMYGPFIMVAADLDLRPRGSIIKTSRGWAMVCDTGGFTEWNPTQLDLAVTW